MNRYLTLFVFALLFSSACNQSDKCLENYSNCTDKCGTTIRDAGLTFASGIDECQSQLRVGIADCEGKENPEARRACINFALNQCSDCLDEYSKTFRSKLYKGGKCRDNCRGIAEDCAGKELPRKDILGTSKGE